MSQMVLFAVTKIFNIGYEGHTIESFIRLLQERGIKRIIDVRNNPVSRKPFFSKKRLQQKLQESGIEYVHFPELGIPSRMRQTLRTNDDYSALFARYESEILPYVTDSVDRVAELLAEEPSALMCFEDDPKHCHRYRLSHYIASRTDFVEACIRKR